MKRRSLVREITELSQSICFIFNVNLYEEVILLHAEGLFHSCVESACVCGEALHKRAHGLKWAECTECVSLLTGAQHDHESHIRANIAKTTIFGLLFNVAYPASGIQQRRT